MSIKYNKKMVDVGDTFFSYCFNCKKFHWYDNKNIETYKSESFEWRCRECGKEYEPTRVKHDN